MGTKVVFFDSLQNPEVLERDQDFSLADVTNYYDNVVHVPVGEVTRVVCAWNYGYHRIPITGIDRQPDCQVRDKSIPTPIISNAQIELDSATGKAWIISFDVLPEVVDSWEVNVSALCEYNDPIRGFQQHRRYQYFTLSTQPDIKYALDAIR